MKSNFFFLKALFMVSLLFSRQESHEIFVNTQDGEIFVFDVDSNERLIDLEEKLTAFLEGRNQTYLVEFIPEKPAIANLVAQKQGGYLGYPRDYSLEADPILKEDIRLIVISLANKSLVTIARMRDDIDAAGTRIDKLHPLRFLETVFTDEELKVGIKNIRNRGTIWRRFLGGLKDCLMTEASIGNVRFEHYNHFCGRVKIEQKILNHAFTVQDWDTFINLCIDKIPRSGDENRYDDC